MTSNTAATAIKRLDAVQRHMMMSTNAATASSSSSFDSQGGVELSHDFVKQQEGAAHRLEVDKLVADFSVKMNSVNCTRIFTLDRPKKLNALNEDMIDRISRVVTRQVSADNVQILLGTSSSPRAFCAGGDIAEVARLSTSSLETEGPSSALRFFKKEFELDYTLASFSKDTVVPEPSSSSSSRDVSLKPKAYVAIMDGITMGGGAGLAFGAVIRIATEKTQFAMPETLIGYSPDVGASYYLNQIDESLGLYLALTGTTLKGRSVFEFGIATHYVPSSSLPSLIDEITNLTTLDSIQQLSNIVETFTHPPQFITTEEADHPLFFKGEIKAALDTIFRLPTLNQIRTSLASWSSFENASPVVQNWAKETLEVLDKRSPVSLEVTFESMQRSAQGKVAQAGQDGLGPLRKALDREFNMAKTFVDNVSPDFQIGVKHVVVDKNRTSSPPWTTNSSTPITTFFPSSQPVHLDFVPLHHSNTPRFNAYGLPSEDDIRVFLTRDSRDVTVTMEDVVRRFKGEEKMGVREKVMDVLGRKCEVGANGGVKWVEVGQYR